MNYTLLRISKVLYEFSPSLTLRLLFTTFFLTFADLLSVYLVQQSFSAKPSFSFLSSLHRDSTFSLTFTLIFFVLVLYIFRIFCTKRLFQLSSSFSSDLTTRLFSSYLSLDYEFAVTVPPSKFITLVTKQSSEMLGSVINPLFNIFSTFSSFIVILFFVTLQYPIVIFFFLSMVFAYILLLSLLNPVLNSMNVTYPVLLEQQYKLINDALYSLPFIHTSFTQNVFKSNFLLSDRKIKSIAVNLQFFTLSPRLVLEALMSVSILTAFSLFKFSTAELAVLSFALLRIIPAANTLYASYVSIKANSLSFFEVTGFSDSLSDFIAIKDFSDSKNSVVPHSEISFNNPVYTFPSSSILTQFFSKTIDPFDAGLARSGKLNFPDIVFRRGFITSLVGPSGSGKSTFLELLAGLRSFDTGTFFIDASNLLCPLAYLKFPQGFVSYMPQYIPLLSCSLLDNVSYPRDSADLSCDDLDLIQEIMDMSLSDIVTIQLSPSSTDLSGGQRQRLGLLRAILGNSELILMDEPTSAQDHFNEKRILSCLHKLKANKFIVMTAHRELPISMSDSIVRF